MKKFIGDRAFYRKVFAVAIPVMIQNGVTNFVSLLDNLMVGQIGTTQMNGVAIANQLIFVFNLFIFGAISGAGIFGAQFFGRGDYENVRNVLRLKIYICAIICVLCMTAFVLFGEPLLSLYLSEGGESAGNPEETLRVGYTYLMIMLFGLIPSALTQALAGTLRESGETVLPMKAGVLAVLVNLVFNYLLIFGHLGFPALGVAGAAIATVLSRFVEIGVIFFEIVRNHERFYFLHGLFSTARIPSLLLRSVAKKGSPLMVNELLWSVGMAAVTQAYSVRGLAVVAGLNISTTVSNLFNIVFMALGTSVSILVGQRLGAGETEQAVDDNRKLTFFAGAICILIGALLAAASPFIPLLYNTEENVRALATSFILISAITMPLHAIAHCTYFTMRSGGRTGITFLFDSVYVLCVTLPIVWLLTHGTSLAIVAVYLIAQFSDGIKALIGLVLVKKRIWVRNLAVNTQQVAAEET